MPDKCDIAQFEASGQGFQKWTLRSVAGNQESDIGQALHRLHQVIDAFFCGQPPEIQNWRVRPGMGHNLRWAILKMWQHFDLSVRPALAVFYQFLFGELAWRQNQIYAFFIS